MDKLVAVADVSDVSHHFDSSHNDGMFTIPNQMHDSAWPMNCFPVVEAQWWCTSGGLQHTSQLVTNSNKGGEILQGSLPGCCSPVQKPLRYFLNQLNSNIRSVQVRNCALEVRVQVQNECSKTFMSHAHIFWQRLYKQVQYFRQQGTIGTIFSSILIA